MKEVTPELRVRVLIEFVTTARSFQELEIFSKRLREAVSGLLTETSHLPNPRIKPFVPPVINIPPLLDN